ncbi:hypothetical protein [Bacillus atrophaeus]|uniref:hypothetical protein n=1 Tax=Bacillus atrophaeus TaxID=1452 RepID=UPI00227F2E75|nr:hypothetical protein [Bacillus atrophaeus]MCY8513122.1 hypothetical protein [Bacillus atrophaeus]MCY8992291.1 hypothetical protein [Bacillus atrophaeus]
MGEWAPFWVSLLSVLFIAVVILIKLEVIRKGLLFSHKNEVTGVGDHVTIASGVKLITHDGGHESSGINLTNIHILILVAEFMIGFFHKIIA